MNFLFIGSPIGFHQASFEFQFRMRVHPQWRDIQLLVKCKNNIRNEWISLVCTTLQFRTLSLFDFNEICKCFGVGRIANVWSQNYYRIPRAFVFPKSSWEKIMCDTILPRVFPITVKLDTSVIIVQTLVSKRMIYWRIYGQTADVLNLQTLGPSRKCLTCVSTSSFSSQNTSFFNLFCKRKLTKSKVGTI